MLKLTTTAGLLATAAMLVPATADAARATFSVKVEAQRVADWDHPRAEGGGDCNGRTWARGRGSDDFKLWSGTEGRLVLEGTRRGLSSYEFGVAGPRGTLSTDSPPAKGYVKRERFWASGTTGGWCGGARQDPAPENDCGTRLPPFTYRLQMYEGKIGIRETKGSLPRENFNFYRCQLLTPEHVPTDSLPTVEELLPLGKVFNPREGKVEVKGRHTYGPSLTPLGNGLNVTRNATYTWKITLRRIKNLTPRSENG